MSPSPLYPGDVATTATGTLVVIVAALETQLLAREVRDGRPVGMTLVYDPAALVQAFLSADQARTLYAITNGLELADVPAYPPGCREHGRDLLAEWCAAEQEAARLQQVGHMMAFLVARDRGYGSFAATLIDSHRQHGHLWQADLLAGAYTGQLLLLQDVPAASWCCPGCGWQLPDPVSG